jgi:hypothetical protein
MLHNALTGVWIATSLFFLSLTWGDSVGYTTIVLAL